MLRRHRIAIWHMKKNWQSFFIPFLFLALLLKPNPSRSEAPSSFRSGSLLFSKDCDPKAKAALSGGDVCAADPALPNGASFLDLLKQIFPDLRPDGTSSGPSKAPRKYLGQFYLSDPEAPAASGSNQKVFLPAGDFAFLTVGERVAILDRNSGWLAYFQVQPAPKL